MYARPITLGVVVAATIVASAAASRSLDVCGTYSGRGCAPPSARVDLQPPTFTHPTRITNPLFPISSLRSAVLLGRVDGKPFRSETTLLPGTSTAVWNGRTIRVRLSQYMAFVNGRIDEVALDRYAQADDGSVWYLGEDVFDYRNGTIFTTEGTWLAGRDGPPAMIMPAKPKVGDVFRTENVPGVVFEEVTVKAVGRRVRGPHGSVPGSMIGDELHLEGTHSPKTFAPGYGEFLTIEGRDREALALAAPIDRLGRTLPQQLRSFVTGTFGILEDARLGDWQAAGSTITGLQAEWRSIRSVAPPLIAPLLRRNLSELARAVHRHRPMRTEQLAIDVARSALDLELRYRPVAAVDVERFHLWTQQLRVHADAHDVGGVNGDTAAIEWLRDRLTARFTSTVLRQIDNSIRNLRIATDSRNLAAAADHAARLGAVVRRLEAAG